MSICRFFLLIGHNWLAVLRFYGVTVCEEKGVPIMAFEPENVLEQCLISAADHPSSRPRFYEELAKSDIFVITKSPVEIKNGIIEANTTISIRNVILDGKRYIPIFTSVLRLQKFINEPESYIGINSLDFFNLTKGADVMLNPGSDYGKSFLVSEIASILDGSIGQPRERYTVEKETTVQIGVPANPPTELLSELSKLFRTLKEVRSAYNVLINNPEDGLGSHTLIGIEATGDWDRLMASAGIVADGIKVPNPPIDFIQLNDGDDLAQHLRTSYKPFFKRKTFGLF